MTDEQLWAIENRALSVDEAVLSEAAEHYNPAGAAEADFADNAPQDVLALVKELKVQRQRAEAAEAALAAVPVDDITFLWRAAPRNSASQRACMRVGDWLQEFRK